MPGEFELLGDIHHKPRQMVGRQSLVHGRRSQLRRAPIHCSNVVHHDTRHASQLLL